MATGSFGESLSGMEQLAANAEPRVTAHPLLQDIHSELRNALTEVRDVKTRQLEAQATAQAVTKEVVAALTRARDLAARLRAGLTTLFGKHDERLVEFGIKPIRRRPRKGPIETPVEDAPTEPDLDTDVN
ncbi:MAG TPA: hypothetical protein VEL74_23005 [Thermoanaerobaculia bacterium]|nr:hypothetical protein [Thermoanaerobaculia bacterium]